MGRSFYIITVLVGFLSGVLLYLVIQPAMTVLLGVFGICVLLLVWDAYLRRISISRDAKTRPLRIFVCVFVLAACIGLVRAGLSEHRITAGQIDFYNGKTVEGEGVITETDIRRDKAKYTICAEYVIPSSVGGIRESHLQIPLKPISEKIQITGNILISTDKYPQYSYGDRVKISGKLEEPGEFDGFSYSDYLSRYGVYSVMYHPRVEVIGKGEGSMFWRAMSYLQNAFIQRINKILPEPHASFEAGLLVGARKGIPDDLIAKFNITGLTHIIAISGYNITIIIVFVMWVLRRLPRKIGFMIAVISIIIFTLFVGASPAVVRASIMGILGLIALNYGRQNNINITVLFTAFFMVFWNPKILWWDAGFQLSFAAVLGLIYVSPVFSRYAEKLPEAFGIREAILMTLSAQVMALPIIIYSFGRLSLIAPISNLFVVFAIPPAMLFGFLAVIFSFVSGGVSLIFGYITWGILTYIIKIIEFMAGIPYASINIPGCGLWIIFLYYAALIWFLYRRL
jgi:competence protein ComEC